MDTMSEKGVPTFVLFSSDEGTGLLNLGQIRMVDEIRDGHCRIHFSESHRVEMHGDGATKLMALLMGHSMTLSGEPSAALFDDQGEQKA
jgi:hypothetical protein